MAYEESRTKKIMGPKRNGRRPQSVTSANIAFLPLGFVLLAGLLGAQSLDYQTYKTTVQPIFLKKRPGHARCLVCHAGANHAFRLEPLNKGASAWTETQSRKNFETVSHLVKPGAPLSSILLIQPLAHSAGGAEFHSGGRQFASQNDPDWQAMAAWVKGAK